MLLIAGGLITSGLLEAYFRYHESKDTLALIQKEAANVAGVKIEMFIHDVETAMRSAARGQNIGREGIVADYKFELKGLFFLAPAITEATVLSADGVQLMNLSRYLAASPDAERDFSDSATFQKAKNGQTYFGAVHLVRGSESMKRRQATYFTGQKNQPVPFRFTPTRLGPGTNLDRDRDRS